MSESRLKNGSLQLPATLQLQVGDDVSQSHIYDVVLPFLEASGVFLSDYGNHTGDRGTCSIQEYQVRKKNQSLFSMVMVKEAMQVIPEALTTCRKYRSSYSLKHVVERADSSYKANGDVILALLLMGHRARVQCGREKLTNPGFRLRASREATERHYLRVHAPPVHLHVDVNVDVVDAVDPCSRQGSRGTLTAHSIGLDHEKCPRNTGDLSYAKAF